MIQNLDLSGLKDLYIPKAPDFFPPAWGWWVVSGGIILFIFILYRVILNRASFSAKYYALQELNNLYKKEKKPVLLGREISKLLKRIALVRFPKEQVAHLSESKWELFLMKHNPGIFSPDQANFIAFSTFLPDNKMGTVDTDLLVKQTRLWIKRIFKGKTNGNQAK